MGNALRFHLATAGLGVFNQDYLLTPAPPSTHQEHRPHILIHLRHASARLAILEAPRPGGALHLPPRLACCFPVPHPPFPQVPLATDADRESLLCQNKTTKRGK